MPRDGASNLENFKKKLFDIVEKKSAKTNFTIVSIHSPFAAITWRRLRAKFAKTHYNITAGMVSHVAEIYRFN